MKINIGVSALAVCLIKLQETAQKFSLTNLELSFLLRLSLKSIVYKDITISEAGFEIVNYVRNSESFVNLSLDEEFFVLDVFEVLSRK